MSMFVGLIVLPSSIAASRICRRTHGNRDKPRITLY